ncbi:ExeM/NucH family extracellular endonuclease [Vibrio zhugei]|uniref:ExeM/NucH family extracellular endonuclease n=1 Tax=Vibrio zhugei TaxID=2479546 RepID=A0ABV7C908_9VIBR|nr:ExeM/NucH family extracellular endonuclease [Vibrio zhugei]
MNQRYQLLLWGGLATSLAFQVQADVLISEYIEGSGYNKAIEITNTGEQSVSLDGYTLQKATNGATSWRNTLSLAGYELASKQTLVVVNSRATDELLSKADITNNTITGFNGNDPIGLFYNGALHDVIGVVGSDSYWGQDVTLVRQTTQASRDYQPDQWQEYGKDEFADLGAWTPPSDGGTDPQFTCRLPSGAFPNFTAIHAIQGPGDRSPFVPSGATQSPDDYYVKGVVTAVTGNITKGFYLQSLQADSDMRTSEGLFVFTDQAQTNLNPGDVVCVHGKVREYYQLTEFVPNEDQWRVVDQQQVPAAQAVHISADDASFAQTLERYEGMLVRLPRSLDMRVTRVFGYDYDAYRNNMALSQGQVNYHPNQFDPAGSAQSKQVQATNQQRVLVVETDKPAPDGVIPYYPDFARTDGNQDGSADDYLRINDTLFNLEGIVTYTYSNYRLLATNTIDGQDIVHNTPRTESPQVNAGDLRIASFNVLNYFNSPFNGDANRFGDNRGASSYGEFELQQEKIVTALDHLDADIVGLMEIENNGFGQGAAIRQLVEQLNLRQNEQDKYTFVTIDSNQDGMMDEDDSVGTDAIAVGLIYRPSKVALQTKRVIAMPEQKAPPIYDANGELIDNGKHQQRDSLAATFRVTTTGNELTVAVNHFKSKGSKCWEDNAPVSQGGQAGQDPDLQGSCEDFRVAAAVALGKALQNMPGDKVILGDLNSYAKEDPILVLTDYSPEHYDKVIHAARNTYIDGQLQFGDEGAQITHSYGYLNAVPMFHPLSWSYSYNNEVGNLDHVLISKHLAPFVVDANEWHINADESTLFDYRDEYKGSNLPRYGDQFRSSDHNPAVLELRFSQ